MSAKKIFIVAYKIVVISFFGLVALWKVILKPMIGDMLADLKNDKE